MSWRIYIDVSFPRPSSAPYLDIRVYRHSNCIGLHTFFTALVPRLTESRNTNAIKQLLKYVNGVELTKLTTE